MTLSGRRMAIGWVSQGNWNVTLGDDRGEGNYRGQGANAGLWKSGRESILHFSLFELRGTGHCHACTACLARERQ